MITITLRGNPLSTNSIYKVVCRGKFPTLYMSAKGKAVKEDYQWQAKAQYKSKPLTDKLFVFVNTYHGTKRKADWDNFHKLSMDSLTGIVYEDDSQIEQVCVSKFYDKENPRIEIKIQKLI